MKYTLAFAAILSLAGCITTNSTPADITNNLGLACQSAQQLLTLPATVGAKSGSSVAISATKLSAKVETYCIAATIAAPVVASVLNDLNTQAAVLLGTGIANK